MHEIPRTPQEIDNQASLIAYLYSRPPNARITKLRLTTDQYAALGGPFHPITGDPIYRTIYGIPVQLYDE